MAKIYVYSIHADGIQSCCLRAREVRKDQYYKFYHPDWLEAYKNNLVGNISGASFINGNAYIPPIHGQDKSNVRMFLYSKEELPLSTVQEMFNDMITERLNTYRDLQKSIKTLTEHYSLNQFVVKHTEEISQQPLAWQNKSNESQQEIEEDERDI